MSDTPSPSKVHVVVLAAQRPGVVNALAAAAGVSHKCIMPMCGRPLIEHVLTSLKVSPAVTRITISIDDPEALKRVALVQDLTAEGRLHIVPSASNLAESVIGAGAAAQIYPMVVTTADNALLTPEMLAYFLEHMVHHDVAVAMTRKDVLLAKYPDGQRRFHRFRDGEWSNCNLYAIMNAEALEVANVFKGGGQFAKSLKRVRKAFGLLNMIFYRFALLRRDHALARVGQRHGLRLGAVDMPFPEAPIDVDNERTARITGEILAARAVA